MKNTESETTHQIQQINLDDQAIDFLTTAQADDNQYLDGVSVSLADAICYISTHMPDPKEQEYTLANEIMTELAHLRANLNKLRYSNLILTAFLNFGSLLLI